jgi:hypothetical protein
MYGGPGVALGGGILDSDYAVTVLENNTITQNIHDGAAYALPPPPTTSNGGYYTNYLSSDDAGIAIGNPNNLTLLNNVIQGNRDSNDTASDFFSTPGELMNVSNNFIGSISANFDASSTTGDIIGNPQVQLGNVVGVDANGNPTGGPIYYPLLSGTVSVVSGTLGTLDTIAGVEGTSSTNATDEIGNPRSSNDSIDLGAIQVAVPISSYALIVTSNPISQNVYAGSNVTFTATASGNPAPAVQWQVSTDGGKTWSNIGDATSTTLTVDKVTVAMIGNEYRAVFTNSSGSVTSLAAALTATAPWITSEPNSQFRTAGQTATFTASAGGDPTPTVQWQVSTGGIFPPTIIPGATSTTLTLTNVTASMNGYEYQAVFTNAAGTAFTNAATLLVGPAPPPPSPSPPSPSPTLSPIQLLVAISLDMDAINLQGFPPALTFLNAISEQLLGQPLPPMADLIPSIEGDIAAWMNLVV